MAEEKKTAAPEEKKEPVGEAEEVRVAHDALNTKYNPFTLSMLRLYLCLLIPYLCGCLNGYDGSLMGGLNGMDSYLAFFNMYAPAYAITLDPSLTQAGKPPDRPRASSLPSTISVPYPRSFSLGRSTTTGAAAWVCSLAP